MKILFRSLFALLLVFHVSLAEAALVATDRGNGARNTASETTYLITPGSNFTAGAMAILCLSYDNSGTAGIDSYSSITDSNGNTWTSRQNDTYNPLGTDTGVSVRIFTTNQAGGTLTTGSTITVNFSAVTTARSYTLQEVVGTGVPTYVQGATAQAAASSTPSITTANLAAASFVIGVVAREGNGTRTDDADTNNSGGIAWSAGNKNGIGSGVAGSEIISQWKQNVSAGAQTYNPTFAGSARDTVLAWIEVNEGAAPTATPTTAPTSTPATRIKDVIAIGMVPARR